MPAPNPDEDIVDAELVPDEAPAAPAGEQAGGQAPAPRTEQRTGSRTGSLTEPLTAGGWTPPAVAGDYTDAGVPTLGYLRDRVEGRLGRSSASVELAEAEQQRSDAARAALEEQRRVEAEQRDRQRQEAAAARLADIRRSLHPDG